MFVCLGGWHHRYAAYLVDKENTGNDFGLALLTPLCNLGVDLFAHFRLDFTSVACKRCSIVGEKESVREINR